MRDELEIPVPRLAPLQPAYRAAAQRPPRAGGSLDRSARRLLAIGLVMAGLLVAGVAASRLLFHHAPGSAVPLVQADSRPLRTRPDNRGGLQIDGADDAILSGDASGKEAMAPPPESPAPDSLQEQAARDLAARQAAAAAAAAAAAHAATAPAALPAAPPAATAAAAPPAARAVTHPPTKVAAATPPLSALGGHAQVQLAAVESEAAAHAEWQRLTRRMPDLLGGRQLSVQRSERAGKAYFRLRTGGFADIAQATAFCELVRAKGSGCSLASF